MRHGQTRGIERWLGQAYRRAFDCYTRDLTRLGAALPASTDPAATLGPIDPIVATASGLEALFPPGSPALGSARSALELLHHRWADAAADFGVTPHPSWTERALTASTIATSEPVPGPTVRSGASQRAAVGG